MEQVDLLCLTCGTHFIEQFSNCSLPTGLVCPRCGAENVIRLDLSVFETGG